MNTKKRRGFTLVEVIITVVVIAILAGITAVAYNGVQKRAIDASVMRTVADAQKSIQTYNTFHRYYPENIADTDYVPPQTVAVVLYTNEKQAPKYSSLTPDQNAQLFLNACNGAMPIVDNGTTYNTACVYNGNNEHVKGQVSSNVVIQGPTIQQADFKLICGTLCDTATQKILTTFIAEGGTFPVQVPKNGSALPAPTSYIADPSCTDISCHATDYCLEGRSPDYADIRYHSTPKSPSMPENGPCPVNADLHYP